ncbi:MAG TPA: hypothetical protein VJK03_00995 [Candidatus Nanoarchaeia archaeon]|nr:hypothetical protein [Candidatus Nanoarchaeia archaeon]
MSYIETLLTQWESLGVFDFVLPFLLIFAFVFGILSTTNILGTNKGVHVTISLVIGLLALRMGFVQDFFREIFPRTGVAIAVILVLVILTAIFIPKEHLGGWAIGFYSLGGLAAVIVVFNSFSELSFFGSNWWHEWGAMIIGALLVIGVIIAVSVSGGSKGQSQQKGYTFAPIRTD